VEHDDTNPLLSNPSTGTLLSDTGPVPVVKPITDTSATSSTLKTRGNKWVRRILFFTLFFLILLSYSNLFVAAILATLVNLLSVSIFDSISNAILEYCEKVIKILGSPFILVWKFLFLNHLTPFGRWFTGNISRGFARYRQFITIMVTLIVTIIMLASTILRPQFATGFGNLNDSVCLYSHLPWFSCSSGFGVTTLQDGVRIGLIGDNSYGPFDQSSLNTEEIYTESRIFAEDRQACSVQHITLVNVTMLSRTIEDPVSTAILGLENLQGGYLAQHAYNSTHPSVSICLFIANLGTADTANKDSTLVKSCPDCYSLPQVVHQIAQLAHTDPSFRGIVGFPYSQQAVEALNAVKAYQDLAAIPIISPSASTDELSNMPNFYRIVSPDHSQGTALAQFFCDSLVHNQPDASVAMFTDSSNPYSRSLELAFNDAVHCGNPTNRTTISYTNGDTNSIQNAVTQALKQHVTYILFPGYDVDMDTVELEIHQTLQEHARDITIIGGDGINNVDATTHYSYNLVYATTFAGPLPKTDPVAKSFIQQKFSKPSFLNAIQSYLWIPTDTLLAYDAVSAFAQTLRNLPDEDFTQNDFNTILANVSFNGVSGEITFQGTRKNGHSSDRDQGYIYITCDDYAHNIHLITQYSTINASNSAAQNLPLNQKQGASTCS
jgi:ABC-type branched-subunit amino acid transport system substrate-binding protein